MKSLKITHIFLFFALSMATLNAWAQCDPMTADQCPDPENNGQVCPETLAPGFLNQSYSVVATILPPPEIDTLGFQVAINHITLDSVLNLPPGLTWESNAVNNEFYPGTYYCILMQGTPTIADTFHLKIYIGIFVALFGDTIQVTQLVDSTSLSLIILDNTGIAESRDPYFHILDNYPNPFNTWTSLRYYLEEPAVVEFELYSPMGSLIDSRQTAARRGENYLHYNGEDLSPGPYYYLLRSGAKAAAGKIVKVE